MAAATITQILDDLNDYADYEALGSVSRAKSFITAAVRFLGTPQSESDQGSSSSFSHDSVEKLLAHARHYVATNDTANAASSSAVRFLSASEGFRR